MTPTGAPERDLARVAEAKREFYRRADVAAGYERQRFGGRSGAHVNARELRIVGELLPEGGVVADVGCGTGRLLPLLGKRASALLGVDASAAMLAAASRRSTDGARQNGRGSRPPALVQADAFALPIRPGACDALTCLRVLFHFDDPRPLLRELRRAVRPGGVLVCDTASWSPRSFLPLDRRRWGDRVAAISPRAFRAAARASGWRVRAERPCFLVSPYVYRRLPLPAARALEWVETKVPGELLCRRFWALEAV